MPRSLPLGADRAQAPEFAGTVEVYDPAMCCPTGLCGAGVDPALLTIARDLRWLEKQGVTVHRFGLAQEPDAFASNARIAGLMQAFSDQALPAVLVNGVVLCHGSYPSRNDIVAALGKQVTDRKPAEGSCCTPGSGCC